MLELPFTIFGVPPTRQYRIGCQFYLCRARLIQDKAQKQAYVLSPARKLHKCILQKIMSLMMNGDILTYLSLHPGQPEHLFLWRCCEHGRERPGEI